MLELLWLLIKIAISLAVVVLIVVLAFAISPLDGWITVFVFVIALVTGFLVHWRLEKNKTTRNKPSGR
ncbi:MAG: hypothetical protein IJE50_01060 [Clostridia bacterium]|nr:hypothetical protein [Clostridia bacterium]